MLTAEVDVIILLVEVVLQRRIGRQFEAHTDGRAEAFRPADIVLQVERPLVGLHLRDKHRVVFVIAIGGGEEAWRGAHDSRPLAVSRLFLCHLIDPVA